MQGLILVYHWSNPDSCANFYISLLLQRSLPDALNMYAFDIFFPGMLSFSVARGSLLV